MQKEKQRSLQKGSSITVFDGQKRELGTGTFVQQSYLADLKITVYECEEHTILAKDGHYLRVSGQTHFCTEK